MKYIYVVLMLLMSVSISAQKNSTIAKSDSIHWEKGKKFYIHTVVKGQTVYSIAKLYGVKSQDIEDINPEASKGLQLGQMLKIPAPKTDKDTKKVAEKTPPTDKIIVKEKKITAKDTTTKSLGLHIIQPKETLSSIAKKFGMKLENLRLLNPGIEDNLKIGERINVWGGDTILAPEVKPAEKLKEEAKTEAPIYDCDKPLLKKTYNVCLMLPLYLNNVSEIQTSKLEDLKDPLSQKSFAFIQFYEGALLAVDSLEKMGFSAKFYVYDVGEDTAVTRKILLKKDMQDMDLIIGPLFSSNFKMVAEFAKKNNINIVNPFSARSELLKNNPNVFKIIPSLQLQYENLFATLQSQHPNANVILVHNKKEEEVKYAEKAIPIINSAFKNNKSFKGAHTVIYSETGIEGIKKKLQPTDCNIIFTLSSGEAFLQNYIRNLYELKDSSLLLVGTQEWEKYDNIESEYFLDTHLHLFGPSYVDYSETGVRDFVSKFRGRFQIEPELEKFAFQGYDICFYFMSALLKYGTRFDRCIEQYPYSGLQTHYEFISTPGNGFENKYNNVFCMENYRMLNARNLKKD